MKRGCTVEALLTDTLSAYITEYLKRNKNKSIDPADYLSGADLDAVNYCLSKGQYSAYLRSFYASHPVRGFDVVSTSMEVDLNSDFDSLINSAIMVYTEEAQIWVREFYNAVKSFCKDLTSQQFLEVLSYNYYVMDFIIIGKDINSDKVAVITDLYDKRVKYLDMKEISYITSIYNIFANRIIQSAVKPKKGTYIMLFNESCMLIKITLKKMPTTEVGDAIHYKPTFDYDSYLTTCYEIYKKYDFSYKADFTNNAKALIAYVKWYKSQLSTYMNELTAENCEEILWKAIDDLIHTRRMIYNFEYGFGNCLLDGIPRVIDEVEPDNVGAGLTKSSTYSFMHACLSGMVRGWVSLGPVLTLYVSTLTIAFTKSVELTYENVYGVLMSTSAELVRIIGELLVLDTTVSDSEDFTKSMQALEDDISELRTYIQEERHLNIC